MKKILFSLFLSILAITAKAQNPKQQSFIAPTDSFFIEEYTETINGVKSPVNGNNRVMCTKTLLPPQYATYYLSDRVFYQRIMEQCIFQLEVIFIDGIPSRIESQTVYIGGNVIKRSMKIKVADPSLSAGKDIGQQ